MPNEKNIRTVEDLKEKIGNAKSVVLFDYRNLNSNDLNELRAQVKEKNAEVIVAKNTLLKVAFKDDKNIKDLENDLQGLTAVILSFDDPIEPIKVLYSFVDRLNVPNVKSAIIDHVYSDSDAVEQISKIPTKDVLLARFAGNLNSPLTSFISICSTTQRNFMFALKTIANQKSEGGVTNE